MAGECHADFIVRLTADCPLIPANLISKHIQTALKENYDYLSNVDPKWRTSPDGFDCEVLSRQALNWAHEHAVTPYDKEHVTPLLRASPPSWLTVGHMVGFVDLAGIKLSLDTEQDLERIRAHYGRVKAILDDLEVLYGKRNVHRF